MKILNFGSVNIDRVFKVEEIVRPGQTISSQGMQLFPGGKGFNQTLALAKAGADVYHAGMIGNDGLWLKKMLEEAGADCTYLFTTDTDTGSAFIQIDAEGQNCIVLDAGANHKNRSELTDQVIEGFSAGDILLLQNEINGIDYIIEKCHEKGMTIVLNPSPMNDALLAYPLEHVDWFIMNEDEGMRLTGKESSTDILDSVEKNYPGTSVVLTLGSEGAVAMHRGERYTQGAYKTHVVDTTGAGDTFTGYFLAFFAKGAPIAKCLDTAARAASIAISRMGAGTSIPKIGEVFCEE